MKESDMAPAREAALFQLVLIKPTHYDDDGYPIQWFRSAIPSNTLACLNGLAEDARRRARVDCVGRRSDQSVPPRGRPRTSVSRCRPTGLHWGISCIWLYRHVGRVAERHPRRPGDGHFAVCRRGGGRPARYGVARRLGGSVATTLQLYGQPAVA